MFYYKKIDKDGNPTGLRSATCKQSTSKGVVKIDRAEFVGTARDFSNTPSSQATLDRIKINKKMREIAVQALVAEGELPEDYK